MSSSVEVEIPQTHPLPANVDNEIIDKTPSIHEQIKNLSTFKTTKLLHNNSKRKSICIQGKFDDDDGVAIVLFEKTAFTEEPLVKDESDYFVKENLLKKVFHNDIYGNYEFSIKPELNLIKTTIIHPATQEHIQKYSVQNLYVINETPKIYQEITSPYLDTKKLNLQWVYNILDHTQEADRIVYEDPDPNTGFILIPDLKWDGTLETLYLLAIVHAKDIRSLRDLDEKHLPLLKNIEKKGIQAIEEKYKLDSSQLRIYLHYQPSFYHLHVHFTFIKHEAPGITAERSHLLSNVISNIECFPDYYQKVAIPYVVRESELLFEKFVEAGILCKRSENQ